MWASMSVGESGLPTAGATVSHYRVLSALGVGGMGAVYLAEDLKLKRKLALKFLKKTGDAHSVSRLLREAETASALDHPNIATIYEIGEWNGQPFIAMAFVPGETLLQRLRRGPMTIDEIAGVGAQIASGLAAAHEVGIVHRDLKRANVMLTPTGQAKILDFGLARNVSPDFDTMTRLTTEQTTVGTLAYMAPEQLSSADVDQRADVWAFGIVLYEMLAGRTPFDARALLNGKYDFNFPEKSSQEPFFDALGTPPADKRRVVYPTGHNLPRNEMIKETLEWLTGTLGVVD